MWYQYTLLAGTGDTHNANNSKTVKKRSRKKRQYGIFKRTSTLIEQFNGTELKEPTTSATKARNAIGPTEFRRNPQSKANVGLENEPCTDNLSRQHAAAATTSLHRETQEEHDEPSEPDEPNAPNEPNEPKPTSQIQKAEPNAPIDAWRQIPKVFQLLGRGGPPTQLYSAANELPPSECTSAAVAGNFMFADRDLMI